MLTISTIVSHGGARRRGINRLVIFRLTSEQQANPLLRNVASKPRGLGRLR